MKVQHKPTIAGVTIAEATQAAEDKFRAVLASPASDRDRKFATRGLAAIERLKLFEREPVQQ